jgi:methylenetetrahydrofolate dehydrogenase (NADP+)/methenyltetrahydrofolate cyclohydrolase
MSAEIIDGKALASAVREEVRRRVAALRETDRTVRLDAVLVGEDRAASIYARNQATTCEKVGIEYVLHTLPGTASYEDVAGRVLLLNADDDVHAIMVHLPLPDVVDTERVQSLIDPEKDVEGVNPANIGNVVYGRRSLVPCTALATLEMIESTGILRPGMRCVIVGASNIVGKPVAVLLMRAEATVISTNEYTEDLSSLTRSADVLVSAAGVPRLITADMVKPGAVVVDVGINRVPGPDGKMMTVGDVAFDEVIDVAGHLSPVPGGVGPMTVAMMLRNTVESREPLRASRAAEHR